MRTTGKSRVLMATGAVAALLLTPAAAHAAARAGSITMVDVTPAGAPGDGYPAGQDISDDGRFVAFSSGSSDLLPGDTNDTYDVFVRDLQTGVTVLASRGLHGEPADAISVEPAISGNGRYVVFTSWASNLVPGDTNGERDVFVYDRTTGTTTRAGVGTGGAQLGGFQSAGSISDNGRFVTFLSTGPGQHAYVHDMKTGATTQIGTSTDPVFQAVVSGDGKKVAFSGSGDFAGDGGSVSGVYLFDLATGTTTRISPQTVGDTAVDASVPSIDRHATVVSFSSTAPIDESDTNNGTDLYVRDVASGATTLASVNKSGTGAGDTETYDGTLSANGRYLAFFSTASNLVPKDTNGINDVFLRDLKTAKTTLVTVSATGGATNGYSWGGAPSANGSRVLFYSEASNLGVDTGNDGLQHQYVRCLRAC